MNNNGAIDALLAACDTVPGQMLAAGVQGKPGRLLLRLCEPDDIGPLLDILQHPQVLACPDFNHNVTVEGLARSIANGNDCWQRHGAGSITVLENGHIVGRIYFARNTLNEFDIGWVVDPACWGRGIAFEAASALLTHVFASTAIRVVTAYAFIDNTRSTRLVKSLGFKETARKEIAGQVSVRYELHAR
ncbi:GNAT family N-acetyltransferase [Andreprevotia sp. IGB-42]|uniref:GNAT family N-acetyltransferase n=1 Tax=Andreprevotia sp. IGB-42 TaxID=2497473 RepID=UPI00135841C8|nr:GNAT family N-acetyltransferase [Andreprevotia sp. IGB-42]